MANEYISTISAAITRSVKRFPGTIFFAVVTMIAGIMITHSHENENAIAPVILCATLGIVASLIIHMISEVYRPKTVITSALWVLMVAGLGLYYMYLRDLFFHNMEDSVCIWVTFFGTHILGILLVSFIYFTRNKDNQPFLDFNRMCFSRFVISFFFCSVVYIGLVLAMLALDNLFGVDIDGDLYLDLLIIVSTVLFAIYLLSGLPDKDVQKVENPSIVLKVFSKYIMIPIVSIYAVILVAYAIKSIIFPDDNPEWTRWLVLWFYILGFLTFLLNLSISYSEENTWSRGFTKWFIYCIIPITILILWSLFNSIRLEGITELKYILATISIFLLGLSIYFLVSKDEKYRWIPIVLSVLTTVTIYGPQSACPASVRSQKKILKKDLEKAGLMKDGVLVKSEDKKLENTSSMVDQVYFLGNRNAIRSLQEWDANGVLGDSMTQSLLANFISDNSTTQYFNEYLEFKPLPEIDLEKYDRLIPHMDAFFSGERNGQSISLSRDRKYFLLYNDDSVTDTLMIPEIKIEKLKKSRMMQVSSTVDTFDLFITDMNFTNQEALRIDYFQGTFFKRK